MTDFFTLDFGTGDPSPFSFRVYRQGARVVAVSGVGDVCQMGCVQLTARRPRGHYRRVTSPHRAARCPAGLSRTFRNKIQLNVLKLERRIDNYVDLIIADQKV